MALDFVKINQGLDLLARSRVVKDKILEAQALSLLRFDGNPDLDVTGLAVRNAVLSVWQAQRDALASQGRDLIIQGVT